jgi:hypothetical protein
MDALVVLLTPAWLTLFLVLSFERTDPFFRMHVGGRLHACGSGDAGPSADS